VEQYSHRRLGTRVSTPHCSLDQRTGVSRHAVGQ
jgi:hypothetical protein